MQKVLPLPCLRIALLAKFALLATIKKGKGRDALADDHDRLAFHTSS